MTFNIPLEQIDDNPWQTRQTYTDLEDLAEDIHQNGLLQPPVVRMNTDWAEIRYELAFGHRRFRAWKLLHEKYGAAYAEFPTELRELTDEQMADFAWSENEKRRDVSPIERMHAIQKQMADFGWSQAEIARRRGLNTATVSNILRLAQLPAELQTKVHTGEMSERQAISLLPYYALPETVRTAASKKTWISDPVKYAEQGKPSDDIRNAVSGLVRQTAEELDETWLEQVIEGEGILSPTCAACPHHFKHGNAAWCSDQRKTCLAAKRQAGRLALLQEAHELTGLPILEKDTKYRAMYSLPQGASLHNTGDHPGLLAQGCEHLRVRLDSTAVASESLTEKRFHGVVGIVCCHPGSACACAKAMAEARQSVLAQADPKAAARREAEAQEQAQRDRLVNAFHTHLVQPTRGALVELLQAQDVRAWRLLIDQLFDHLPWEEIAQFDLPTCQEKLAEKLTSYYQWRILRDTDEVVDMVNTNRARLGLAPLELPEEAYGEQNPVAKFERRLQRIERRLQRIEGWLERVEDDEEEATPEAVRGNLVNLEHIQREYLALPEDEQTLPGFADRLEAHVASLSQWLDEYEAESDEEDEELLEAYIGEAVA